MNRKEHWEVVYRTKTNREMSWFQRKPETSLRFLKASALPLDARVIDVGGGDSTFVDFALQMGYRNVTVLDISEEAINRSRKALGAKAETVTWIVADITTTSFAEKFDFWHDRAVFHFLTDARDVQAYIALAQNSLQENGIFVLGTFSASGPEKCSGLPVKRYSEESMTALLQAGFQRVECFEEEHKTPFETFQSFLFCSFKRMAA